MDQLINDGWKFAKMPLGSTIAAAKSDGTWTDVDLPHDWLIWQAEDLYESADAWYVRELKMPDELPETCLIRFDGVYMDCEVLLNGEVIVSHPYGYTAFQADLSGKLQSGENELMVHIRHHSPNSRWYSGSGIFRDVTMMTLPRNYIIPYSFYMMENQDDGPDRTIRITAETSRSDSIPFNCKVTDGDGNTVAETRTNSRNGRIEATLTIPNAILWSVDDPYLYHFHYQYGKQTEVWNIGLRSVCFHPEHGFFLNDQHIKLKGVCLHHDLGALGAAFHPKAARRQLALMKDMGVNALRTSHNPPAEKLLDLCDEMGILVIDEAFDMWERPKTEYDYARFFPEHEKEDVAAWIRRDRCHPCVIMWSIGNEIYDMHADMRGTEVTRMLKEQVESHDPEKHAAVTFGCNYMPWEGGQRCADVVKIAGYNYGEKYYDEHHRQHPDWVIYGSETASVLSSRGIYHFPIEQSIMSEADLQCSALGNSNTSWGADDLRTMIVNDLKNPYSMGQFIWSGIDYIGEPTPYHTRSCYFGQADTACFPKDSYYLFRSLWSDQITLHIGVYWDWNPGQMIDVPVMTNCAEAELLLNGRSVGRKKVNLCDASRCLPVWKIPYEPGELKAIGYGPEGNELLTDVRYTPSDTDHMVLTAEDEYLMSDGDDMTFVIVSAADENGYPVNNARDRVRIRVSGGGCLMGTDNGDSTDPDGYKSDDRRLFGGKLMVMIGSTGKTEDIRVRVEYGEGKTDEIVIPVRKTALKNGVSRMMRIDETSGSRPNPVRKIEIRAMEPKELTRDHSSCVFEWRHFPKDADVPSVQWSITNAAGIDTPFAELAAEGNRVKVTAAGDGSFYLRAMCGENEGHPDIISQIEFSSTGIGNPAIDPYSFVSAGLYDLSAGDIGTGNEKGIAFARDGESMAGFSRVDFGKAGSDTLILPIFALNGDPYDIELFDGIPGEGGRLVETLRYQKPSIWNVYQEEVYRLPERLTGVRTICFRMKDKVHLKGFTFERQSRAFTSHAAAEADAIYGDSFIRDGSAIREIGNNVTLDFEDMEFDGTGRSMLEITGSTPLAMNTITVRMKGENGESVTGIAEFAGGGEKNQRFAMHVPEGSCTVSFVFLPGSHFDFEGFRFEKLDSSGIIS